MYVLLTLIIEIQRYVKYLVSPIILSLTLLIHLMSGTTESGVTKHSHQPNEVKIRPTGTAQGYSIVDWVGERNILQSVIR